jgi:protein PhnA
LLVKIGARVRNIRRVHGDHNTDCRIDAMGAMQLKPVFVWKVQ